MKKVMVVFGTRPEAIKMCPVVLELEKSEKLSTVVCVTGQHKEMLSQVLELFGVEPGYNLEVMRPGQDLFDVTGAVLSGMKEIYEKEKPDVVLVQGDTTTAYASALAAFYMHIKVAHVEAGLRTGNLDSPFPEEFNRIGIDTIAGLYFAPTRDARQNLLKEGKHSGDIIITGNTGIDALKTTVRKEFSHPVLTWAEGSRLLVVTAHRRENLGEPLKSMLRAIRRVVEENPDVKAVYPVHPNPEVLKTAQEVLKGCERVMLSPAMSAETFHNIMARCCFILTDSGGVQEEAPALGKPVLVMRDTTERYEGIESGTARLIGTDERNIYESCRRLLVDERVYRSMSEAPNPYGDGRASVRIREALEKL